MIAMDRGIRTQSITQGELMIRKRSGWKSRISTMAAKR